MVAIRFNVVVIMSKLNYYLQSNEHIIIIDSHCDGFALLLNPPGPLLLQIPLWINVVTRYGASFVVRDV